jgi:hypothetical protein
VVAGSVVGTAAVVSGGTAVVGGGTVVVVGGAVVVGGGAVVVVGGAVVGVGWTGGRVVVGGRLVGVVVMGGGAGGVTAAGGVTGRWSGGAPGRTLPGTTRTAPTYPSRQMEATLTTSPVCGAWTIRPLPMYRPTWWIVPGFRAWSP